MIRNYFLTALRALSRDKAHALINILGLGLGIGVCILIILFVRDEWTFDTFHSKASRIYRVYAKEDWGENQQFFNTVTPFPMGPALKSNFPEVERQVRFNTLESSVRVGEKQFTETIAIAGQDFFRVFDFAVRKGDRELALNDQGNVVLTQSMALKYFGEEDPIGKELSIQLGEKYEDFVVKAVVEDVPTNSSIQFTVLLSDLNYPRLYSERTLVNGWFNITPETYVLLQENISATTLEKKFPSVFRTILGEEEFSKSKYTAGLQPLTSIHLDTYYPVGIAPVSNPMYAYILAGMAALLLFVACINFVTLSIGRSVKRAKEVGIRKVVGAARSQLIIQFIGEALLVTVIALGAGIVLAGVGLPLFNDLSGKHLIFQLNGFLLLVALVLMVVIGLIAGSYPAFVLSNFKPIAILKGKMVTGRQGVRKVLVGIQIVLSIFLVSSTLIMRQQLTYLQNKDLGFHREQLAVVPLQVPRVGRLADRMKAGFEKVEQFKAELVKIPEVLSVGGSSHDFANGGWTSVGYTDDQGTYRNFTVNIVDDDYIPTLKIEMKTGRNFSEVNTSDPRRGIIVNEAFVREYGWKEPLGKRIPGKGFIDHEIIGVVKDFNYASLYTKVTPLVMAMDATIPLSGSENINIDNSPVPKLMIRFRPDNLAVTMEKVKGVWDRLTNGQEFEFAFVDQALAAQYRNDQNLSKIVSVATLLAMVIGSLGLYALAALAMQNRTKEIGIRKVMGATESSLLMLLSKDYVYLIGISLLFSIPITWYLMRQWLQAFEYRINVGWGVFAMAGALSLLVALLTISYQVVKSAWTMPAETLKYE